MFFITNPYLMLAKRGGSLPIFQGDEGSSEVDLTDSDGDGIPDNAVIEDGSAYWTDENGNVQMANIDPQGNWKIESGNVDSATGLTFRQAFRQARDAGQETFMWNGSSYNTKTESEEEEENQKGNNEEVEENKEGKDNETDINEGIDDKTIDENDELTDLEKAQLKAQQADLGFRNPDQATILSGIGDNPILELADAIERGVKSFGSDQYYDPGSKEDYMKYTVRNVSDQDMVYDPKDRLKAMYNPGKYLKTNKEFEDEIIEEGMMDFYKQRRKEGAGGKDMYGRVKDFDVDQFRETGIGATYGRKGPGIGDQMENKYQDASYLGFSNVNGNVRPLDYLTKGPGFATVDGDPNTYIRQDFEGSSTFDRSDDSEEWQRSMRNPLNQPITLPKIGPSSIPVDNTLPEPILANEPVDSPTDYQEPGLEDLKPLPPNMVRYGGGLTRYQDKGQVNEEGMMTGPDGEPINIMLPEVELIEKDPNWWRRNKRKVSNIGHGILDVAGLIPGVGELADGLNAAWYAAEGDKVNAALSAAAMIPFAGWAATGGKYVNKAVKGVNKSKANKGILSGGKKGIDESMEYAAKYTSDPDYLRYMNTEKVRLSRELNNAKLNYDINKPTGIGGPYSFDPTAKVPGVSIHDKINSRVSFADMTNPNKKVMSANNQFEFYKNPYLYKRPGDLNLGIGDFRNTYDDLFKDAQRSGFRSSSKVIDDMNTSAGIFYPASFFSGKNANRFTSRSSAGNLYNPFPDGRFYVKGADGSVGVHEYSHFLDHAGRNFSQRQVDDLSSLRRKDKRIMNWNKEDPDFLKDYNYFTDPTEIKARMFQMRQKEGLMPGDQFTMDMLKKYTEPSMFSRIRGDLFGDQSRNMYGMQGYLNLNTPGAQQNFLNIMNKYKKDGGSLPKAQQLGEFNNPTLGLTVPSLSGYSLSGNQPSPFTTPGPSLSNPTGLINTSFLTTPTTEDQYKPMTDADMYASSQAVQRSIDSFDAFTADMNKRIENPSLSMNQVDTNPLNVPKVDFSPSPELQKSFDVMDYTMAEQEGRLMGTGFDATIVPSGEDMQQQSEEFSANLEEQMSNIPEYQGTQENLDRFEESNERGFDGDLAAMDEFDAQQEQEQADADLARTQIDLASEKPGLADRAYNTLLRAVDSKGAQTYSKISNMAIDMAKPITKIAADRNARKQKSNMMRNAYLSDNMFAATDADTSGNKGNYDPNTGLFRPDDKVVVGTTGSARFGGSFYKSGGAIDIDMNTYKQLVAAGAEITIL
tara:strand:- start:18327 stop:22094 length:3768 start_codon:yes stop_codon:yes gene_type:complete